MLWVRGCAAHQGVRFLIVFYVLSGSGSGIPQGTTPRQSWYLPPPPPPPTLPRDLLPQKCLHFLSTETVLSIASWSAILPEAL